LVGSLPYNTCVAIATQVLYPNRKVPRVKQAAPLERGYSVSGKQSGWRQRSIDIQPVFWYPYGNSYCYKDMTIFTTKPEQVTQVLNAGGVVIFPTETLYGLGCDVTNPQALLKLYKIKQREFGKAFPILVRDFKMLAEYAAFSAEQKKFMQKNKKPTNFVLKAKTLSPLATLKHTAAFRLASAPFVKKIFKTFDKPIVATSANITKQDPLSDPRDYARVFGKDSDLIDAVVFTGINKKKKGSRIIDLTSRPYKVLRK
jgi:L-threonylcarbamoyladenylate synthase